MQNFVNTLLKIDDILINFARNVKNLKFGYWCSTEEMQNEEVSQSEAGEMADAVAAVRAAVRAAKDLCIAGPSAETSAAVRSHAPPP